MCQTQTTEGDSPVDIDDEEDDRIIRAKWTIDGARTLEEAAVKLERFAAYLREIRAEGWELRRVVDDDYGFLRFTPPQQQPVE
jgi:hypothetical protein